MLQKTNIFLIFFLALFGGLISSLGVPRIFSVSSELLIYMLLLFSFLSRSGKGIPIPHLWYVFSAFIFIAMLSIVLNEIRAERSIFSIRLLFRYYFFYLAIILLELNDDFIKKINLFIVILLVLQFPIVAVKFLKYGISEKTAGGYAIHDGSISTTLPIVFIFYLASFYFLYKRKISFILIGIGYVVCSIVGAKRAVFFLYPVQFLSIYYYIFSKGTNAKLTKKIAFIMCGSFILIVLSASILYFNKTLNPDQKVGGEIDIKYAFEYAERYNAGIDGYGRSFGRISTTQRVIEILTEAGIGHVLLGIGPGSTTPSMLDSRKERDRFNESYSELEISYGWTTMNRIAMEYGFVGVFLFFSMLILLTIMCIKLSNKETEPYWRAFASGSVCFSFSMLFFAFAYHWTTFWGDTMPVLYFYAMAIVYIRLYYRPDRINGFLFSDFKNDSRNFNPST
jgi:hypothetical protein